MKKKLILSALIGLAVCGSAVAVNAADIVKPLRAAMEAMGCVVGWDNTTKSITATGDHSYRFTVGSNEAAADGQTVTLPSPVYISDGTAYISEDSLNAVTATQGTEASYPFRLNACFNQNENYVMSPFSLKSALAMTANGAKGQTLTELLTLLGYDSIDELNSDMQRLSDSYKKQSDNLKLTSANSVWVNSTYPELDTEFGKVISSVYNGTTDRGTPTEVSEKITKWVEEKSNGLQKDFSLPLGDDFSLALVNTTYLKATWFNKFSGEATYKDSFTNANGSTSQIDFMNAEFDGIPAYQDDKVSIVKLDYMDSDKDLSFYAAIAPDGTNIESYLNKLEEQDVQLSLPKFKQHTNVSLNDAIGSMGAKLIFGADGDLSGFFGKDGDLFVSSVVQDTVIDVDEYGTEAASTTSVTICGTMYDPEQPLEMKFNEPFTYFIMDNQNNEVLFMGRFANGSAAK